MRILKKVDNNMYRSLIGSLLYLTASRPDILYVVNLLSRFMHSPRETHFTAAKRVLRYIKGTSTLGIFFPTSAEKTVKLVGYSDSDWGGCIVDSKSTSGYLFSEVSFTLQHLVASFSHSVLFTL